jgi:hypothetical protein
MEPHRKHLIIITVKTNEYSDGIPRWWREQIEGRQLPIHPKYYIGGRLAAPSFYIGTTLRKIEQFSASHQGL